MAERAVAYRDFAFSAACALGLALPLLAACAPGAEADASVSAQEQLPVVPAAGPRPWVAVPRIGGRLLAGDIGLVINTADPYSVAVGEHYVMARGLQAAQVLRLELPTKAVLTRDEFAVLSQAVHARFGPATQALALAWAAPYAVECNSITGALALGFDAALCASTCAVSRASGYFNSPSLRPWSVPGWRPSMLLAARTPQAAKALIDRGVAADGSLAAPGRAAVTALLLTTDDLPRRVRMAQYPELALPPAFAVDVRVEPARALAGAQRLLLAITGSARVGLDPAPQWVPGGLGDHLTSLGGDLQGEHGQSTVLDWIASGATASHGAVSEPCNHLQKFPHPQLLLLHYLQGSSAIEAYWKSVAWPQQSLFVGEPLAAPFAAR